MGDVISTRNERVAPQKPAFGREFPVASNDAPFSRQLDGRLGISISGFTGEFTARQFSSPKGRKRRVDMSLGTILLIIVVLMLLGVIPAWPHSSTWGYGPSGGLGLVLIVIIVLLLLGRL